MMAAAVFFFFELNNTPQKWRTSVLVSGLITFIAAVHYYYMRGYNQEKKINLFKHKLKVGIYLNPHFFVHIVLLAVGSTKL